jgi:hypothetical protein
MPRQANSYALFVKANYRNSESFLSNTKRISALWRAKKSSRVKGGAFIGDDKQIYGGDDMKRYRMGWRRGGADNRTWGAMKLGDMKLVLK